MTSHLMSLSDELLLLIVQQLDRHDDVPNFWLTCRKLRALSEEFMYRNTTLTLKEEPSNEFLVKLVKQPPSIAHTKHLTILNQCRLPGSYFYRDTVSRPYSYRIMRWQLLESAAEDMSRIFAQSTFLFGPRFYVDESTVIPDNQLVSFRWRHATALSSKYLARILKKHAGSLVNLEVSMIQPPNAEAVHDLEVTIEAGGIPKLRSLTYYGLSHTEPIPVNQPEKGGRFRMLRPIFRRAHGSLQELILAQDHCVSQIGKTPLINGRTFDAFLCDLDEIYLDPSEPNNAAFDSVILNLFKLELGGFKVATLFNETPRVRVEFSSLHRLVLNDCDGLTQLLQEMQNRKNEISLTEFSLRVQEDEEAFEDFDQLSQHTLGNFLGCFTGLKMLCVLWNGPNAPSSEAVSTALSHHSATLQAYAYCAQNIHDSDDMNSTLRFVSQPPAGSVWAPFMESNRPKLREFGLVISGELENAVSSYACLKLLSQFSDLRTVHIRNFPPRAGKFWRDRNSVVDKSACLKAAKFAKHIALPFYALSKDLEEPNAKATVDLYKLSSVADAHTRKRDQDLLGGVKLKALYSTSTPARDITRRILTQRADIDWHFAGIMHKFENNTATLEESTYYQDYVQRVQTAIGLAEPKDKPKLRLLIVGDWRYRDQMNLSGPRNWDPNAWCTSKTEPVDVDSDEDDDEVREVNDVYAGAQYRLRHGFHKEWDVSLLPIFFKIDWEAVRSESDRKWRWQATATPLDQTTLEGYGALDDVKLLDFAFQN